MSSIFAVFALGFSKTSEFRVSDTIPPLILNESPKVSSSFSKRSTLLYDHWSKASVVKNYFNRISFDDSNIGLNQLLTSLLSEIKFSLQLQLNTNSISKDSYDQQIIALDTLTQKLETYFDDFKLDFISTPPIKVDSLLNENVDLSSHPLTGQFRNAHTVIESLVSYFNLHISKTDDPFNQMQLIIDCFDICHEILIFLSNIDKAAYLGYVSRVKGSSGGDSLQLKSLSSKALQMDTLFKPFTDDELKAAILFKKPHSLYRLIIQYLECKKKLGHFWSFHQIMALGNIGNAKGTSEYRKSTIDGLSVLVRRYAFQGSDQNDDRIYSLLGNTRELFQNFDTGIELEESNDFSYIFGTQSFGPFIQHSISRDLIPTFYLRRSKIDQKFRQLGAFNSSWSVSFGPGASSWFDKIINSDSVVTLPENEFLAAKVAVKHNKNQYLKTSPDQLDSSAYNLISSDSDIYLFSLVNSINQMVLNPSDLENILNQALNSKKKVTVILDGAQAFGNVDMTFLGALLDRYSSIPIAITGSTIKHLSCGKGGFMFTNPAFRDVYPSIGGWTEHVSGLKKNTLVDSTRYFYGDLDTPNAPAYLRFLISFSEVNQDRIKSLHHFFFNHLKSNSYFSKSTLVGYKRYVSLPFSNTLVFYLPSEDYANDLIEFLNRRGIDGIDYKNDAGEIKLRIGFNQNNTEKSVQYLVDSIHLFEFYYDLISAS